MALISSRLLRRLEQKLKDNGAFLLGSSKGVANGVAPLDAGSKLLADNLPGHLTVAALADKISVTEKAAANGVASLGADGKVPAAQITASGGVGMNLVAGSWVVLNPGDYVATAGVPTTGTVTLTPFYLPADLSISSLSVYCQTAAANAVLHLGLYTNVGSAFTRHTLFGTVDGSTTGAKDLAGTWTLPAGVIWLGYLNTGAGAVFAGTNRPRGIPGPILAGTAWSGTATTQDNLALTGPASQATLPASFTSTDMVYTGTPIRFAAKKA